MGIVPNILSTALNIFVVGSMVIVNNNKFRFLFVLVFTIGSNIAKNRHKKNIFLNSLY